MNFKRFGLFALFSLLFSTGCSNNLITKINNVVEESKDNFDYPIANQKEINYIYSELTPRSYASIARNIHIKNIRVKRGSSLFNSEYYFTIDQDSTSCYQKGDRFVFKPGYDIRGIINEYGVFPTKKCTS